MIAVKKKRVLIVDDEVHFTRLLKLNLERNGRYEVEEENRGAQALAAARKFKPDLVLLDIVMPDSSGNEIAAQLREDPELKGIPIIFITAILSREEVTGMGGGLIGGHRFLAKPVKIEEVLACLEQSPEK